MGFAASARADEPALQLVGLGGYISGYAVYTDQDDAGASLREFDFRKDTELHLNGEVALDNGITAGAHLDLLADRADGESQGGGTVEESYLYLSSSWGRINLGEEDGAAGTVVRMTCKPGTSAPTSVGAHSVSAQLT